MFYVLGDGANIIQERLIVFNGVTGKNIACLPFRTFNQSRDGQVALF